MRLPLYLDGWRTAREAISTAIGWREVALRKQAKMDEMALNYVRSQRELAIAFRIAVERPEVDIREELDQLISDLSDQIALAEEHL